MVEAEDGFEEPYMEVVDAADPFHGQLYLAAEKNDIQRFQELIQLGANVDESYEDHMNISTKSILHVCCAKGRCEMVKLLLNSGAFIHVRDKWGQTALMYCMVCQFVEVAEILLMNDSSVADDQDSFGKSALHIAVESGNIDSVKMFINHGANLDIQNIEGYTPLMLSCYSDQADREILNQMLQLLVDSGADIHIRERRSRRTALQMAAVVLNLKGVEILLEAGSDQNEHDGGGRTPLTNAIFINVREGREFNMDVIALAIMLIQRGADLNLDQCEVMNPLMVAVTRGCLPLVELFLSYGANVNVTFHSGATPILLATTKNHQPIIKELIKYNSRLDMKGYVYRKCEQIEYNIDAMEYAIQDGNFDLIRLFTHTGYNLSRFKFLFGKGTIPEKIVNDPEILSFLSFHAQNPRTLLEISVIALRKLIGLQLQEKVQKLPLPSRMKDLLLLKHIFDLF